MKQFGISQEVATLTISLFVAGYCIGPLLWGPLSEEVCITYWSRICHSYLCIVFVTSSDGGPFLLLHSSSTQDSKSAVPCRRILHPLLFSDC